MKSSTQLLNCLGFVMMIAVIVIGQDYYNTLGVDKSASLKDIKKAFRKLALKYHPDKISGEAEKKEAEKIFIKIAEAYETLSNPEKRRQYDMHGSGAHQHQQGTHDQQGAGSNDFNYEEFYKNFDEAFKDFNDGLHSHFKKYFNGLFDDLFSDVDDTEQAELKAHFARHAKLHMENVARAHEMHARAMEQHRQALNAAHHHMDDGILASNNGNCKVTRTVENGKETVHSECTGS